MQDDIQLSNIITPQEYKQLRASAGWSPLSERQVVSELIGSKYILTAKLDGKTVGMAKLVGNAYYMLISDVIVHPDYQGKQIGKRLVEGIIQYAKDSLLPGEECMLYLMSVEGKEPFYEKLGFIRRPHGAWGSGMSIKLKG